MVSCAFLTHYRVRHGAFRLSLSHRFRGTPQIAAMCSFLIHFRVRHIARTHPLLLKRCVGCFSLPDRDRGAAKIDRAAFLRREVDAKYTLGLEYRIHLFLRGLSYNGLPCSPWTPSARKDPTIEFSVRCTSLCDFCYMRKDGEIIVLVSRLLYLSHSRIILGSDQRLCFIVTNRINVRFLLAAPLIFI